MSLEPFEKTYSWRLTRNVRNPCYQRAEEQRYYLQDRDKVMDAPMPHVIVMFGNVKIVCAYAVKKLTVEYLRSQARRSR